MIYLVEVDKYRIIEVFIKMRKNVTQSDIARIAGVTRQTVSLVVNNDPRVKRETKELILDVMDKMGYRPNVAAQNLAKQSSRTIGFHFFGLDRNTFSNPLFTEILAGIYFSATKSNYSVKFYIIGDDEDYSLPFRSGEIDGAIFVTHDKASIEEKLLPISSGGFPIIIIGNHSEIPHINIDHYMGSKLALDHLIKLKSRKILYLGGGLDYISNKQKFEALKELYTAYDLGNIEENTVHDLYKLSHGYNAVKKFIKENGAPDAIFCAVNDQVAAGASKAIHETQLEIPQDVRIIGYDDSVYAKFSSPDLTSVSSPFYKMGDKSAEMIINYIKTGNKPESISLKPKLIIRKSTKSL